MDVSVSPLYFRKMGLINPQVKGVVRKKDKIGRNLCYEDTTGKRVACGTNSKPGYGPKQEAKPQPEQEGQEQTQETQTQREEKPKSPKTPRSRVSDTPYKPLVDKVKGAINEVISKGTITPDGLDSLVRGLSRLSIVNLMEIRKGIGAATKGKVKKDILDSIRQRIENPLEGGENSPKEREAYNTLKRILGDSIDSIDLKDPRSVEDALRNALQKKEREDERKEERGEPTDRAGSEPVTTVTEEDSGGVEEAAEGSGSETTDQSGNDQDKPADSRPAESVSRERVPAKISDVNKRIDRFENFFRSKGQHQVGDWLGKLREHVNAVGTDAALASLNAESANKQTKGDTVQYWGVGTEEANWKNMGDFIEAYLGRNGIITVTGDTSDPDYPLISALGKPDKYVAGQDFKPVNDAFKNKLDEAQHLPGLEKSEDISKLMGKPVTHLTDEVITKLNETYGEGKWIVKCYDDNAAAGYGIFFPQRAAAIAQDAKNTIWAAGENLARYGFELNRDADGKVIGLKHQGGDTYDFGSDKYNNTIQGDARHWGDKAAAASHSEKGALLPEGAFMAQPAFEAVGISDAERAAGKTWHEKNEGRVHLVTKDDGTVEVVPHSTWLKGGNLPVVFEDEDTKAMAKAAQETINKLPPEARKGQVYAPDVMKTKDGYKVVELNAQGDYNGSGYLHDNHFTIDAYTSHLAGRQPQHVAFIRQLLSTKKRDTKSLNGVRYEYVSGPSWVRVSW